MPRRTSRSRSTKRTSRNRPTSRPDARPRGMGRMRRDADKPTGARTTRQEAGDAAEVLVAERLAALGWTILARNVHAGRSELDIVAVDPGPPARLVVVEVRWR